MPSYVEMQKVKALIWGWQKGSADPVLATQAWQTECDTLNPHFTKSSDLHMGTMHSKPLPPTHKFFTK